MKKLQFPKKEAKTPTKNGLSGSRPSSPERGDVVSVRTCAYIHTYIHMHTTNYIYTPSQFNSIHRYVNHQLPLTSWTVSVVCCLNAVTLVWELVVSNLKNWSESVKTMYYQLTTSLWPLYIDIHYVSCCLINDRKKERCTDEREHPFLRNWKSFVICWL